MVLSNVFPSPAVPEIVRYKWPCTPVSDQRQGLNGRISSNPADPRHPRWLPYRCFLPDLTEFVSPRRAGPDSQHRSTAYSDLGDSSSGGN